MSKIRKIDKLHSQVDAILEVLDHLDDTVNRDSIYILLDLCKEKIDETYAEIDKMKLGGIGFDETRTVSDWNADGRTENVGGEAPRDEGVLACESTEHRRDAVSEYGGFF